MLTDKQKQQMKKKRISDYEQKKFSLEMDLVACEAAGDKDVVDSLKDKIEALNKAIQAIGNM